jgi:hypothetical protein
MNSTEKKVLKSALHEINNALNAISMQSELAIMYANKGGNRKLQAVMAGVMKSCRKCSTISHDLQASLLADDS